MVLWEANSGERLQTLSGHTNFIMHIAFSPDGNHLVSGGSDRTARLCPVIPVVTRALT